MTNELTVAPPKPSTFTIIPQTVRENMELAEIIANSGMVPESFCKAKNPAAAIFAAVEMGKGLNLTPMQSLQSIYVVNGIPKVWGDAKLGIVMQSGKLSKIKETFEGEGDKLKAICELIRDGVTEPIRREFSWKEAERAGLTTKKGPWTDYPRRMLQHRARNLALNDAFPDVLCGIVKDDFDDSVQPAPKNITPETESHLASKLQEEFKSETVNTETGEVVDAEIINPEPTPHPEPKEVRQSNAFPETRDEEFHRWITEVKQTVAGKRKKSTLMEYLESDDFQKPYDKYKIEFADEIEELRGFIKGVQADLIAKEKPTEETPPPPKLDDDPQVAEILNHISTKKTLESLKEYQTGIRPILGEIVFSNPTGANKVRAAIEAKSKELGG